MILSAHDTSVLAGEHGEGPAFALRLIVQYGKAVGARELIDISAAHIDGCSYHGEASLDFVRYFTERQARVKVLTTLNVGSMDLIHPELFLGTADFACDARLLMELHEALGCVPSFTCAPYQTLFRPKFGDQIAWAESNAIVFANSVIGARTARYGDFIDLAAAICGRVPLAGLHVRKSRLGQMLFTLPPEVADWPGDALCVAIGYIIGKEAGSSIAVIDGLPRSTSEDDLKALGAVAASSGAVAMFHAVGLTPEAPTRAEALGETYITHAVSLAQLEQALANLSTAKPATKLGAVALGTPHFSIAEFAALMPLLEGFTCAKGVDLYINTARETYARLEANGWRARLESAGFTLVVDTCTYITAVMREINGAVMTNSGKWAHYAPNNLGVDVAFGALRDCIASAASGYVMRVRR